MKYRVLKKNHSKSNILTYVFQWSRHGKVRRAKAEPPEAATDGNAPWLQTNLPVLPLQLVLLLLLLGHVRREPRTETPVNKVTKPIPVLKMALTCMYCTALYCTVLY